jgi:Protein of unknown function (DUF3347)
MKMCTHGRAETGAGETINFPIFAQIFQSMKKPVIIILLLAVAGFVIWKFWLGKKDDGPAREKEKPLAISKNSSAFNESFGRLMTAYYAIASALTDDDTSKANAAANTLVLESDSLKVNELKADSMIVETAKALAGSVAADAKGLLGETSAEGKRRSLQMLSENLYNLIRTVQYDQAIVYHLRTSVAFGGSEEAFWLGSANNAPNPYLGKGNTKHTPGSPGYSIVMDSINYTGK